ncbi:MAG TPA: prepilin peptidase [Pyrinomonadaceae bacterium]|jgi:prepilin peptidase CpaA|nr:prepilin peptidase [Pyrinomonadaceae bacterium]
MRDPLIIIMTVFLLPLAGIITYYDVRYRRIPNAFVLATLATGVLTNVIYGGLSGALASFGGCALAFFLMFTLHIFGAMGAGDVKLFAAIGAVLGASLVLPTFFVIVLTGGALAVVSMIRAGAVRSTLHNVLMVLVGLVPGWKMPRFAVPSDRRHTIPYGVAICFGSLISLAIFRA